MQRARMLLSAEEEPVDFPELRASFRVEAEDQLSHQRVEWQVVALLHAFSLFFFFFFSLSFRMHVRLSVSCLLPVGHAS